MLNPTLNEINAAERVKINQNWDIISARFSNLQSQIQLISGGADVNAIIERIELAISEAQTATGNTQLALQEVSQALSDLQTIMNNANTLNENVQNAIDELNTSLSDLAFKGEYNASTTYAKNNFVRLNKDSYVALKENLGITPSDDGTNWRLVAVGGTDGQGSVASVNGILPNAQGDIEIDVVTQTELLQSLRKISINVMDYGATGDGVTDDTAAIQSAINAAPDGAKILFPTPTSRYRITNSINLINRNRLFLEGNYSLIGFDTNVDDVVFDLNNCRHITVDGLVFSNTETAQTVFKGLTSHHLHVTNCYMDGNKLGFDLTDCYWPKIESVGMQSTYQAFNFRSAINSFLLSNLSINGDGIDSSMVGSIGGSINGCSFEGNSGKIRITSSSGIDFSGNYFEGYNASLVPYYVSIGGANFKDTGGISFNGNLFYSGARSAIYLYNVNGISITGNYINTTYAIEAYTFDGSDQKNINYVGNKYDGNPTNEFIFNGANDTSSISPEFSQNLIFKSKNGNATTLNGTDLSLFNNNGKMILKNNDTQGNLTTSRVWLAKTLQPSEQSSTQLNLGRDGTFLVFTVALESNAQQFQGVYLVQTNINAATNSYVTAIVNSDKVSLSMSENTLTLTNVDTSERYIQSKIVVLP